MKHVILSLLFSLSILPNISAQDNKVKAEPVHGNKISLFSLKDVRLLDSDFKHIMDLNHEYLLSLEPDRMLSWFRREAGLTPKAQPYPFWESEMMNGHGPLPGHIMGFYLSGIAMMYDSTGDAAILEKLKYVLSELALCQQAGVDGYLLPTINGRAIFENVLKGDFKTSNPFINVYEVTGDKKYLKWAQILNDEDMWVPMSEGRDILQGWHANTQIPKFTGFEAVYRHDGNERFTRASRFFWETVVSKHTWVMGGNSTGEHFFAPEEFERRIELNGGPESCNSVNMLRLTESLYRDYAEIEKVDYYEKVLFNHIFANYDPDEGMCVYYTSIKPGHYKVYGTKYDSFWCCTGTGFEQTSKFGQMIYAHTENDLLVNLFIPSTVTWDKGVTLRQETSFPNENSTHLTVSGSASFNLKIRCPYWTTSSALTVKVNGKRERLKAVDGYISINRSWKDGDKVDSELPMKIEVIPLNESVNYLALKYGPIVLAAKVKDEQLTKADFRLARLTVATKDYPVLKVPAFVGNIKKIPSAIVRKPGKELVFECSDKVASQSMELVPFHSIHWSRYIVYFRHYNNKEQIEEQNRQLDETGIAESTLDARTIDRVIVADRESEANHRMEAVNSSNGNNWRDASKGGYFMYELEVHPGIPQSLCLQFLGSDSGNRVFDVLIDGRRIQTIDLSKPNPETKGLYRRTIELPAECIGVKQTITVKFQAGNGSAAGGIFDVRIIKR